MTTKNRFWHFSLTVLALINAETKGCFIHVLDDETTEQDKGPLVENLKERGLVHRYDRLSPSLGFCNTRKVLYERFMSIDRFTHWLHMDDDIVIGPDVIKRASLEYDAQLKEGVLLLFVNAWSKLNGGIKGQFRGVHHGGYAAFYVSKDTLRKFEQFPYSTTDDGETANDRFTRWLREYRMDLYAQAQIPYAVQHTGNMHSVLFGFKPNFENLWARHPRTGAVIEVPGFNIGNLRHQIKRGTLEQYVRGVNERMSQKVLI